MIMLTQQLPVSMTEMRYMLAQRWRAENAPGKDGPVLRGAGLHSSTGCVHSAEASCGHAVLAGRPAGACH